MTKYQIVPDFTENEQKVQLQGVTECNRGVRGYGVGVTGVYLASYPAR